MIVSKHYQKNVYSDKNNDLVFHSNLSISINKCQIYFSWTFLELSVNKSLFELFWAISISAPNTYQF